MNRQERRAKLSKAKRDIKHRNWTPFELRPDVIGHPLMPKGMLRAYTNSMFSVQVYETLYESTAELTWLGVRRHDEGKIGWSDLQRIKNEVLGEPVEALQVFPPQHLLVDQANMYWLVATDEQTSFSKCFPMRA